MYLSIAALLAAFALSSATLVSANPTTTTRTTGLRAHPKIAGRAAGPQPGEYMTNGKRLAAGLPPNKPRRRSLNERGHAAPAKRSATPPISVTGNILVTYTDNGTALGYISPALSDFGYYGGIVSSTVDALDITFSYNVLDPTEISITVNNPDEPSYPFFGAVPNFELDSNDISPSYQNYVVICGTAQTAAGSPPTPAGSTYGAAMGYNSFVESAIWNYDPVTSLLTPQWINEDGSPQAAYIMYDSYDPLSSAPLFALTADTDTVGFNNYWGFDVKVTFTLIQSL